jgi:hypothetical protein
MSSDAADSDRDGGRTDADGRTLTDLPLPP